MSDNTCAGCVHRYWVNASWAGTSHSGWGCRETGGHAVVRCQWYKAEEPEEKFYPVAKLRKERA